MFDYLLLQNGALRLAFTYFHLSHTFGQLFFLSTLGSNLSFHRSQQSTTFFPQTTAR